MFAGMLALVAACAGQEDSEADRLGVGATCDVQEDCPLVEREGVDGTKVEVQLECLTGFRGGYCGISGCTADADCPEASRCVAHTDGVNYCFRVCADKAECNANRSEADASNCSANIVFVDAMGGKACVPPSA